MRVSFYDIVMMDKMKQRTSLAGLKTLQGFSYERR